MTRSQVVTANIRRYATINSGRHFKGGKQMLTLEHFVQRKRALDLWRDIARALNKIPASNTRAEMRKFARDEFERNKDVYDLGHIRYLISTGRTQFDGMRRYIDEQAI
ncbi:hypothetical protein B9Z65_3462 [Elsinoe australis]|uniref:LYR motif-containing protein 2 n=1 Tax=Elsinoe australis TaxID=40998 RepID=A0A2P8A1L3_9PEZI|nr:hypothetical protein B9Z65_3462 [Elsinoe australis]